MTEVDEVSRRWRLRHGNRGKVNTATSGVTAPDLQASFLHLRASLLRKDETKLLSAPKTAEGELADTLEMLAGSRQETLNLRNLVSALQEQLQQAKAEEDIERKKREAAEKTVEELTHQNSGFTAEVADLKSRITELEEAHSQRVVRGSSPAAAFHRQGTGCSSNGGTSVPRSFHTSTGIQRGPSSSSTMAPDNCRPGSIMREASPPAPSLPKGIMSRFLSPTKSTLAKRRASPVRVGRSGSSAAEEV